MYCQNCGNRINENLNYCNSCGVKLAKTNENSQETVAKSLSIALGYIGFIGFIGFAGLIAIMLGKDVRSEVLVMIAVAYLTALFGVCAMILRQISNQTKVRENETQSRLQAHKTAELEMPNAVHQIEEARQPFVGSITDHTTRTLEEVPRRKS